MESISKSRQQRWWVSVLCIAMAASVLARPHSTHSPVQTHRALAGTQDITNILSSNALATDSVDTVLHLLEQRDPVLIDMLESSEPERVKGIFGNPRVVAALVAIQDMEFLQSTLVRLNEADALSLSQILSDAVSARNPVLVKLLRSDFDINLNGMDSKRRTPLLRAIQLADFRMVGLLLEHGAIPDVISYRVLSNNILSWNPSLGNGHERTLCNFYRRPPSGLPSRQGPLHYAINTHCPAVVQVLLDDGANPYLSEDGSNLPFDKAMFLRHTEMSWLLLHSMLASEHSQRLDINNVNAIERLRHLTWIRNSEALIAYFLSEDVLSLPFFLRDNDRILTFSLLLGSSVIAKNYLQKDFPVNQAIDMFSSKMLHYAVAGGNAELANLLLSLGADPLEMNSEGETPIHFAAVGGNEQLLDLLLSKARNIDQNQDKFWKSLSHCAINGQKNMLAIFRIYGVDLGQLQSEETLLHQAAAYDQKDTVEFLIQKGVDIEAVDFAGRSPLLRAMSMVPPAENSALLLLEHGADAAATDSSGSNVLIIGASRMSPNMAAAFLQYGAPFVLSTSAEYYTWPIHQAMLGSEDVLQIFLDSGAGDYIVESGEYVRFFHDLIQCGTPWLVQHRCASSRNVEILVSRVPEILKSDKNGQSILMRAILEKRTELVRILLEGGADPNATSADGDSALHIAIQLGCEEIVNLLIAHEANVQAKNAKGHTPLAEALRFRTLSIALNLLVNHRVEPDEASSELLKQEGLLEDVMRLVKQAKKKSAQK